MATSIDAIRKRLLAEYERRRAARKVGEPKLTLGKLLTDSGLEMDRSTLHRKLHGLAPLSFGEADAIAKPLGLRVKSSASIERAA